ncbi:hypothetical protein F5050DRAFT_991813 [Lentinula boryana]|uniref:Uncharacterized protein n=1 Tax=Lentinula boryana TaxID=40481 RepID=A0ABQ8QTP5_9AGAR|nr:hypothetical protein F5050DRAFT_991813 [Lentinula boryana]
MNSLKRPRMAEGFDQNSNNGQTRILAPSQISNTPCHSPIVHHKPAYNSRVSTVFSGEAQLQSSEHTLSFDNLPNHFKSLKQRLTHLDIQKASLEEEVDQLHSDLSEKLRKREEEILGLTQENTTLFAHLEDAKDIILQLKSQNNVISQKAQERVTELERTLATSIAAKGKLEEKLCKQKATLRALSNEVHLQAYTRLHLAGENKRIDKQCCNLKKENQIKSDELNQHMVLAPSVIAAPAPPSEKSSMKHNSC